MPGSEVISVLNEYLTNRARSAVARLRDPTFGIGSASGHLGIFTGFFVSPAGHLLTAFHPLKHKLWDTQSAATFELDIEFDVMTLPGSTRTPELTRVVARYEPGWSDFKADWALLKLDYAPNAYLPIAEVGHSRPPHVDLSSSVRAYGFTEDQPDLASLGAYNGQYARSFPERSQFRVGFVDRGVGQSGGPVIDLRSRTVIGVVSGLYHRQELLTADAAIIDQEVFAGLGLGADLGKLAYDWRGSAAEYLSSHLTEFRLLAADHSPPSLPETYLRGRQTSRNLLVSLAEGRTSVTILHGARGSGKTSLAIETALDLTDRGIASSVFWYDFDQPRKRSGDQLIPGLALHLMRTQGAFEPLEQYAYGGAGQDSSETVAALIATLRDSAQILVFENVHYLLREQRTDSLLMLERLAQAAAAGRSKVLFTSWDAPREPLNFTSHPVRGLADTELAAYFHLYGLDLSPKTLIYIGEYSDDIVCLEMFVRSPEWRAAVEAGKVLLREPEPLLTYWVTRYTREHVPAQALGILLALAVLEQPADYDTLEAVSVAENFRETLDLLQASPPLIMAGGTTPSEHARNNGSATSLYSAHLNVRHAVLMTADKARVDRVHGRAADVSAAKRDFATAARHRLRSGSPAEALALIRDNRESIIAAGRIKDLEALAAELLPIFQGSADAPKFALHLILASCKNIRGDYAGSSKEWDYALHNPPDALSTAMVLNRRGDSYRLASDYDRAGNDYRQAEAVANTNPTVSYRQELGRARLGVAKLYRLKADYGQARKYYMAAHDAFEECFDEQGLIETSFGVGEVSRLASDWPAAHQAYSESLGKARKAGNAEREAYALWGLGEVFRLTEEYPAAEEAHGQGLEGCVKVCDTRSEGWALLGLAETYRAMNLLDSARIAYNQAMDRFARAKSGTEIAHAILGLCEAERAEGRVHFERYVEVETTYRDKELRHCLLQCLISKAAALRVDGQGGEATACLTEADELAQAASLDHELSIVHTMQADPSAAPPLPLNFP